jgi:hypothetical protein
MISGFRRDVDDIWAILGYYVAPCGNCLPTFRDNLPALFSRVGPLSTDDGIDTLPRNGGKQLSHDPS